MLYKLQSVSQEPLTQNSRSSTDDGLRLPISCSLHQTPESQQSLPYESEEGKEYLLPDRADVTTWIETQLLDCQNMAQQHGLLHITVILDKALDLLEEGIVPEPTK